MLMKRIEPNIVLLEFLKGFGECKHILSDVMAQLQYLLLGVQDLDALSVGVVAGGEGSGDGGSITPVQ